MEYFENDLSGSYQRDVIICIQLLVCVVVIEICTVIIRLHIFNNFLVIWDKVALFESDIVYRLTQNTKNTVLQDTVYFENRVPKLPSVAEFNTVFSNIFNDLTKHSTI